MLQEVELGSTFGNKSWCCLPGVIIRATKLCIVHTQCCTTSCKEMWHVLLGKNSPGRTKLANSLGNNNLNFRLTRDQVVYLETAANLCVSRPDVKRPLKSGNVYFLLEKVYLDSAKTSQRGKCEHFVSSSSSFGAKKWIARVRHPALRSLLPLARRVGKQLCHLQQNVLFLVKSNPEFLSEALEQGQAT